MDQKGRKTHVGFAFVYRDFARVQSESESYVGNPANELDRFNRFGQRIVVNSGNQLHRQKLFVLDWVRLQGQRMKIPEISAELSKKELWLQTVKALDGGDFSWLEKLLVKTGVSIIELLESNGEPTEYMNEGFAWACFTGRTRDAETLLDKGVDPAAGFKTGLAGLHWAVNRGNLETVAMLIKRGAPLEQVNMYGGTVLACALYSAVHEYRDSHAEIIEVLIDAGAVIEPGTLEWWEKQDVPSRATKDRVEAALRLTANKI